MENLIAHRALDDKKYKENTKESIIESFNKTYIKGVEIDIRITKDNKLVVIHDSTINRTSNGIGIVKNMTLKQLKKYSFGTKENKSKICTLNEVLKLTPENKILLIELKCNSDELRYIKYFYNVIKKYQNDNIYIMSFNEELIEKIKKLHPNLKCGLLINKIINKKYLLKDFDFIAISSYSIDEVKDYKKEIFVWAISNKKRYDEIKKKMNQNTYYIVDHPKKYI